MDLSMHVRRLQVVVEDLGDCLGIAQRALERAHSEMQEMRAAEAGQQELPLATAAEDAGEGAEDPRLLRVAAEAEIRSVGIALRDLAPSFGRDVEHDQAMDLVWRLEALADRLG